MHHLDQSPLSKTFLELLFCIGSRSKINMKCVLMLHIFEAWLIEPRECFACVAPVVSFQQSSEISSRFVQPLSGDYR